MLFPIPPISPKWASLISTFSLLSLFRYASHSWSASLLSSIFILHLNQHHLLVLFLQRCDTSYHVSDLLIWLSALLILFTDAYIKLPVYNVTVKVAQSCPTLWDPHGLHCPRNSPGQNAGMGNLSLLQGIFPTQGSNPGLPNCRWILYQLSLFMPWYLVFLKFSHWIK